MLRAISLIITLLLVFSAHSQDAVHGNVTKTILDEDLSNSRPSDLRNVQDITDIFNSIWDKNVESFRNQYPDVKIIANSILPRKMFSNPKHKPLKGKYDGELCNVKHTIPSFCFCEDTWKYWYNFKTDTVMKIHVVKRDPLTVKFYAILDITKKRPEAHQAAENLNFYSYTSTYDNKSMTWSDFVSDTFIIVSITENREGKFSEKIRVLYPKSVVENPKSLESRIRDSLEALQAAAIQKSRDSLNAVKDSIIEARHLDSVNQAKNYKKPGVQSRQTKPPSSNFRGGLSVGLIEDTISISTQLLKKFKKRGNNYVHEDMLIPDKTTIKPPDRISRNPYLLIKTWPDNIVHFNLSWFSRAERDTIYAAIKEIEASCGVTFKKCDTGIVYRVSKIHTEAYGGCSTLGYVDKPICELSDVSKGVVIHEFLHGLGFIHTQERYDRNKYVKVFFENIDPQFKSNFVRINCRWDIGDTTVDLTSALPYDYESIMHYPIYAFSINEEPTILPTEDGQSFGQRFYLSSGDKNMLTSIYGPRQPKSLLDIIIKNIIDRI